MLEVKNALE
jgi:hypothetical protein